MARRLAVLIANQSFEPGSGFDPLRGPHNDIAALETVLTDPARGGFELAVPSLKDAPRNAILASIEAVLREAGRDDTVLIHYSGHGKLDAQGRLYFAAADSHQDRLRASAIRSRDLHELVAESRSRAIVLLLDCCFAGAIGRDMAAGHRGDTASVVQEQLRETAQDAGGLFILASSAGWQTAQETASEEDGQVMGRFTRAVLRRLAEATRAEGEEVRFSTLAGYLRGAFPDQQIRQFVADADGGDPLLARIPARETPAERRQAVLSGWMAQGAIPSDVFAAAYDAAEGSGEPAAVRLAADLLDGDAVRPAAFVAAWRRMTTGGSAAPVAEPARPVSSLRAPPDRQSAHGLSQQPAQAPAGAPDPAPNPAQAAHRVAGFVSLRSRAGTVLAAGVAGAAVLPAVWFSMYGAFDLLPSPFFVCPIAELLDRASGTPAMFAGAIAFNLLLVPIVYDKILRPRMAARAPGPSWWKAGLGYGALLVVLVMSLGQMLTYGAYSPIHTWRELGEGAAVAVPSRIGQGLVIAWVFHRLSLRS